MNAAKDEKDEKYIFVNNEKNKTVYDEIAKFDTIQTSQENEEKLNEMYEKYGKSVFNKFVNILLKKNNNK